MSEELTYNLEEIVSFQPSLPEGEYVVRLKNVELGTTQKGDPQLLATFEVQEGEHSAEEFTKRYFLGAVQGKRGVSYPGIADFKNEVAAIGAMSTTPKKFTTSEFRKLYATVFGKKKLFIMKTRRKDKTRTNEDGTPVVWPNYTITGLASAPATSDPLADLGM